MKVGINPGELYHLFSSSSLSPSRDAHGCKRKRGRRKNGPPLLRHLESWGLFSFLCRCSGGFSVLFPPSFSSDMMKSQKNIQYIHGHRRCLLHSGNRDEENEERSQSLCSALPQREEKNSFVIYVTASSISSSSSLLDPSRVPPSFGDSLRSPANFKLLIHIWRGGGGGCYCFLFFSRPWASSGEKGGERAGTPYEVFFAVFALEGTTTTNDVDVDVRRSRSNEGLFEDEGGGGRRNWEGREIPTETQRGRRLQG